MDLISLGNIQFSASPALSNLHEMRLTTICTPRRGKAESHYSMSLRKEQTGKQRYATSDRHAIWDHQLIESLKSPYTLACFRTYLDELKQEAKWLLRSTKDIGIRLEIIDTMQRLGVAYHFEDGIREALDLIYHSENYNNNNDLYATALQFRLFRQYHYPVNSEVFEKFKNEDGRFMEHLSQDAEGLLSLYEASHLLINGEDILEEAKKFTCRCLKSLEDYKTIDHDLAMQVKHSLQTPLHWRMQRVEARNFIDVSERDGEWNLVLVELAKLDFNLVQSLHQRDLIELSRWWTDLGFRQTPLFSTNRLVENFIWANGMTVHESQFSNCRQSFTKFACIFSALDNIYNVYSSLDELEGFTEAVSRWDVKAIENLPKYMKRCYLAMFNNANKIAYDIHRDQGLYILPYIMKEWVSFCKSSLVEARWFYNGYTPTLEEYLANARITVGAPAAMAHAYILQGNEISADSLDCLKDGSELVYFASIINRLNQDLGASKAEVMRGDVPKPIQCYMKEMDVSREYAREHIKGLMSSCWKKLNEECMKSSLPKSIINMALDIARTGADQCGFEQEDGVTKHRPRCSMFIELIAIEQGLVM